MPDFTDILHSFQHYQPIRKEEKRYEFVTFHQSYSYEEFVEGLKPVLNSETENGEIRYQIEPGIFKQLARRADQIRRKISQFSSTKSIVEISLKYSANLSHSSNPINVKAKPKN